jgi:hypothetical protein
MFISKIGLRFLNSSFKILPKTNSILFQSIVRSNSSIKLIDKRFRNLNSRENFYSSEVNKTPTIAAHETSLPKTEQSLSIFKRFKEAYKQHGKVLIYCHITTCFGWIIGFFLLSKR